MNQWKENAKQIEKVYGGHVDWEERFYECPECGEPVYECDWSEEELKNELCPVCGFYEGFYEEDGEGWDEFEPGKFNYDEMAANP